DISIDEQFSYRNGKIVYAAYETDPRWGGRDYSVIKILDVHKNEERILTRRTKYFTPDISPDGKMIAAVLFEPSGKSRIDILNEEDGSVIRSISSGDIQMFTDPKFIDNDRLVTCVRLKDGRMALAMAEVNTGNSMRLTTPSFNVVGYPCADNGNVYFTGSYEGNDDIYSFNLQSGKLYKLTNGPLGNYYVNA